jgi:hypothetical protein
VRFDDPTHPLEVAGQQRAHISGSVASPIAVDPVTSQKSTVTVFRCSRPPAAIGAPQNGQNAKSPERSLPHDAQTGTPLNLRSRARQLNGG